MLFKAVSILNKRFCPAARKQLEYTNRHCAPAPAVTRCQDGALPAAAGALTRKGSRA
jgi:hypothetical protein